MTSRLAMFGRSMATLGWGIAAPIAGFYVLRAFGIPDLYALVAGAAVTVLAAGIRYLRMRRIDTMPLAFAAIAVLGLGVGLVGGGPRFLLARDSIVTGACAVWFALTVWRGVPAGLAFGRPLMEPLMPTRRDWDELWRNEPVFRRGWRVATMIWAVAMGADAIVRFATALLLPIDVVPALNGVLWAVLFVVLQVVTNVYFHACGMFRILFARTSPGAGGVRRDR